MWKFVVVLALVATAQADMYLQNMRGSNNRLDEANRDRDNANRLFDSQNNNRGGYNVGSLYFYEGERIPFEWTNQHGCGNEWNDCQIVLQYMCSPNLRDGTTTNTIPEQPSNCLNNDCNRDIRFGMHEDYDYYMNCKYRFRNRGLFTADRNLNGNTARFTRQNENGNRRGYECPEERDHYPYWGPTPWVDIAILTDDASRCPFYRSESENVKGRYFCSLPDKWYHSMVANGGNGNNGFIPNTQEQCLALNAPNSAMMTFLRQQAAVDAAALTKLIDLELSTCFNTISVTDNAATLTADDLVAQCPSCPANWQLHPYSTCQLCIPNECAASLEAYNLTIYNTTGCAPGKVRNSDINAAYCINADCIGRTSTYAELQAVDTCRGNLIAPTGNRLLVDANGFCVRRQPMSANCLTLTITRANWTLSAPHNSSLTFLDPEGPICLQNQWSRVNHLGNGFGGFTNGMNFTFPPQYDENCAMRIRYNITTADYAGLDPMNSGQVNSTLNRRNGEEGARVDIRGWYGLPSINPTVPHLNARGYYFKQNPQVQIFDFYQARPYCSDIRRVVPGDPLRCFTDNNVNATNRRMVPATAMGYCPRSAPFLFYINPTPTTGMPVMCSSDNTSATATGMFTNDQDIRLQLAINTNQFGRTFQDRSHKFAMRERPPVMSAECGTIYSLNVRGKRGNIVQTFPGTEYDYTPNRLNLAEGDCIHPQWTGSNTNPNNNDGQGRAGTDRHNIAQQICIRGQGGLGVNGPGGRGAGGTTWTTQNLEPGWQGWVQDASPTMVDMQCPPSANPTYTMVHPFNRFVCVGPACTYTARPFVINNVSNARVYTDCPSGRAVDPNNPTVCTSTSAACMGAPRPRNPTQWTSGLDPLDPTALGFNASQIGVPNALKHGCWGMSHPEHLDNVTFLGLSRSDLMHLAILDNMQFGGNMKELDDAGTYFDLGVRKVTGVGTYHYMCTRNNNFSNRSQKGKIIILATPENKMVLSSTGGVLPVSLAQSYRPATQTPQTVIASSDYWMKIPPRCLTAATPVSMATMPAPATSSQASDVVLITPTDLACRVQISPVPLVAANTRRATATVLSDMTAQVTITNGSSISFLITSSGFKAFYDNWQVDRAAGRRTGPPFVQVWFNNADNSINSGKLTEYFTNQFTITDDWPNMRASQVQAFESGSMWVSVDLDGTVYTGPATTVADTLNAITVRIPVSVTMQYGNVYYYPNTPEGAACAAGTGDSLFCSTIRQQVANAKVSDGAAVFQVGGSTTTPAGGFYYVSPGTNLAIIIGVTIACVVAALAAIGSAVYFRKHPSKWEAFKTWGPRKYKAIKRNFSSQV